ncbi:hypothetical protein RND81_06G216900 [Saponaria officinalis]|uniref:Uncharacterized protein n=1 Tax=Saponaria officinalis TaxID=3572 RepID=A0AAW1KEH5_SAPOF
MSVSTKFPYQKLHQNVIFQEQDDNEVPRISITKRQSSSRISWSTRLRRLRLRKNIRGFRKLFKIRRVKVVRVSWAKIMKRLKESRSHFGDLFAGNYLFMQVNPAFFNNKTYLSHHNHHVNH